jgi:hypothetical protein
MPDEDPGRQEEKYNLIVFEVFHSLSQPLTALHCSLELSLQRDQTVEELRAGIQTALENAFLEYLLRYARTGNTIAIRVGASGKQAEVVIHADSSLPIGVSAESSTAGIDPGPYSCEIEIVRRSFRAPGGEFALTSYGPDAAIWRATLPCSGKIPSSVDSGNRAF